MLQVVTISFEYFLTQADADFLYIHDGVDAGSSLIAKLQETYQTSVGSFWSSQEYMFVRFTSDSSINYGGFKAIYQSVSYGTIYHPSINIYSCTISQVIRLHVSCADSFSQNTQSECKVYLERIISMRSLYRDEIHSLIRWTSCTKFSS